MSISEEELNAPKDITEGAILELINHWLMEYKPNSTIEPTSKGVPTCEAVYNFIKGGAAKNYQMNIEGMDNAEIGAFISLANSMSLLKQGLDGYKYARVRFATDNQGVITHKFPPLFSNVIYDIKEIITTATTEEYSQSPPTATSTALMWIFLNDEDNRITYLHRWCDLVSFSGDPAAYLWISPLKRSYVGSNGVVVNAEPTAAQKSRCIIKNLYFYTSI